MCEYYLIFFDGQNKVKKIEMYLTLDQFKASLLNKIDFFFSKKSVLNIFFLWPKTFVGYCLWTRKANDCTTNL